MKISYSKLWKLLIDKDMKKSELREQAQIGSNTLVQLNKGEYVSMETLLRICGALDCDIGDIVEVVHES